MYTLQGYDGYDWEILETDTDPEFLSTLVNEHADMDIIRLVDQNGNELETWL